LAVKEVTVGKRAKVRRVEIMKGKKVNMRHMSSRERVCQKTSSFLRVLPHVKQKKFFDDSAKKIHSLD
jgi:hypothetical protein